MAQSPWRMILEAFIARSTAASTWRFQARLLQLGKVSLCFGILHALGCVSALGTSTMQESSQPADAAQFKIMRFSEFIGEASESLLLPLNVAIPTRYEKVSIAEAPDDYSFWMLPEEMEAVKATGDLPGDTGYFYTKISLDVGYDAGQELFLGFEDRDPDAELRSIGVEDFEWDRTDFSGYPAILTQFTSPSTTTVHYGAYIATHYEGIVFYIVYVPPASDSLAGAAIWRHFVSTLEQGSR